MSKNSSIKNETMKILKRYPSHPKNIIPILQDIQRKYNYLPKEIFPIIARSLKMTEAEIYGVATFYTQFGFVKPGRHEIEVCMGTACHVKGSDNLLETIKLELGIKPGETTKDNLFNLRRVACLGCCALAPVVRIDGEVHGKMTRAKLLSLLKLLSLVNEMKEGE